MPAVIESHGVVYRIGMDKQTIFDAADCFVLAGRYDMAIDILTRTLMTNDEAQAHVQGILQRVQQQLQDMQTQMASQQVASAPDLVVYQGGANEATDAVDSEATEESIRFLEAAEEAERAWEATEEVDAADPEQTDGYRGEENLEAQ